MGPLIKKCYIVMKLRHRVNLLTLTSVILGK